MKISTAGKNSSSLKITVAVAMLAGAVLSGCASAPSNDSPRFSRTSYIQPVAQSGRWIDPPANRYYDPRSNEPSGRGPQ